METIQNLTYNPDQVHFKRRASTKLLIRLGAILLLTLVGILTQYIHGYTAGFAYLGWLLFMVALYQIFVLDTFFFLLMFMIILGHWGVITSLTLIETGAFMGEIQEYGYPTGGTMRFAFYILLFFIGAYTVLYLIIYPKILKRPVDLQFLNSSILLIGFYLLLSGIMLTLNLVVVFYGSPLWLGLYRTEYWANVAPPGTEYLHNTLPQLSCISGVIFTQALNKKWKKIILFLFFMTLITQVLQGEKFSKLLATTYFFTLPLMLNKLLLKNTRINFRLVFYSVLLVIVALSLIVLNYTLVKGSSAMAFLTLANRLSLQGQVWWATDRLMTMGPDDISFFYHHVFGFGTTEDDIGLYYLMNLISPIRAIQYYESGASFTCGYPSIILLGSGYILGIPALLFCGAFMGFVIFLLFEFLRRKDIIPVLFAIKLFFLCYLAFVMGAMQLFLTPKFFLFFGGAICFYYVRFKSNNVPKIPAEKEILNTTNNKNEFIK